MSQVSLGRIIRFAEFGDVGPRAEIAVRADQHEGFHAGVRLASSEIIFDFLQQPAGLRQRVKRWVVEGDDADGALFSELS